MAVKAKVAQARQAIVGKTRWRVTSEDLANFFATKLEAELGPHDLRRLMSEREDDLLVLDVRDERAYREERIPGAVNIPFSKLEERWRELPRDKRIITYCWNVTCFLCTKAALALAQRGFRVSELVGGIEEWKRSEFPVETT